MPAITFTITRTGDLTKDGSVDWTLETDLVNADFAPGQFKTGSVNWTANEAGAKTVVFTTVGNTADNPDRFIRLRLSNPVNATLGTDNAETIILDDDAATPTTGFDGALPLGGLGVGAVCLWGQPGNQKSGSASILQFRCEHTGSIDRISWDNRIGDGYNEGDGGQLAFVIRRITSARGVTPVVLGEEVCRTPTINAAAVTSSWNAHWRAFGGSGGASSDFARWPSVMMETPGQVTAGEMLAFMHTHIGGSGVSSFNCSYTTKRDRDNFSPHPYYDIHRVFSNGSRSSFRDPYMAILTYGYTDGFVCGQPHMGLASGNLTPEQEHIVLGDGAGVRARQVVPMPDWTIGKTIRRVHTFFTRYVNTTSADLQCQIRRAASGNADGVVLAGRTLAANTIRFEDNIKGTNQTQDPIPFNIFDFGSPGVPVSRVNNVNPTLYFEMSQVGGSTSYIGERNLRWLNVSGRGVGNPSYLFSGMRGQIDRGNGSWVTLASNGVDCDLGLYAEFA